MKKRIQIIVQPVDNGYTIQANSSDHPSGQNAKAANLVANDADEVVTHLAKFLSTAFASTAPTTGPEGTNTNSA